MPEQNRCGFRQSAHERKNCCRACRVDQPYEFSFSGLKTAVLRLAQAEIGEDYGFPSHQLAERLSEAQKADIAASFQRIAVETVVEKTVLAFHEHSPASVVVAGGVAASPELRRQLETRLQVVLDASQDLGSDASQGATEEAERTVQTSTESEHRRSATQRSAESADGVGGSANKQASAAQILRYTDMKLCTDNGAMIAALAHHMAQGGVEPVDPYALNIKPNFPM